MPGCIGDGSFRPQYNCPQPFGFGNRVIERCDMHVVHPGTRARDWSIRYFTTKIARWHRFRFDVPVFRGRHELNPPVEQLAIELGENGRRFCIYLEMPYGSLQRTTPLC